MRRLHRILHVDDVPGIRVVIRVALERIGGFEVCSCETGEQAIEALQRFAPDLILLDAMLPGMAGAQVLERLSEQLDLEQIPVVFLTGNVEPAYRSELLTLGAREVLIKPFDPRQLPARLEQIWREKAPSM